MATIDPSLIETLLNMGEGEVLDFKRNQYPFAGASDEQKGEIAKDIVAFANAWKTTDAHIFIGADENPGRRATVVGITDHLDDADLQQLVNSKTNVPVVFEYIPIRVDGMQAAIVRIDSKQHRPIFLRKPFGKLKAGVVYIRRGSSTAEALPDEVARMGASAASTALEPVVSVEMAEPKERKRLGGSVVLISMLLDDPPPPPRILRKAGQNASIESLVAAQFEEMRRQVVVPLARVPGPDPTKVARYRRQVGLLNPLGFLAENVGRVLVPDARIVVQIPKANALLVLDELPKKPLGPFAIPSIAASIGPGKGSRFTRVERIGDAWEILAVLGKIQPNATAWSLPFWIGSSEECELKLVARVYADNIGKAIEVPLTIKINLAQGVIDDEGRDDEYEDDVEEDA